MCVDTCIDMHALWDVRTWTCVHRPRRRTRTRTRTARHGTARHRTARTYIRTFTDSPAQSTCSRLTAALPVSVCGGQVAQGRLVFHSECSSALGGGGRHEYLVCVMIVASRATNVVNELVQFLIRCRTPCHSCQHTSNIHPVMYTHRTRCIVPSLIETLSSEARSAVTCSQPAHLCMATS